MVLPEWKLRRDAEGGDFVSAPRRSLPLFLFEQPDKPGKNRIVFFMRGGPQKKTILVVSLSPEQADVRKRVLEAAGYRVIAAKTVVNVITTCETRRVDLAMIGYSLPPAEKRRVWSDCPGDRRW
jgi:hypothetical protein